MTPLSEDEITAITERLETLLELAARFARGDNLPPWCAEDLPASTPRSVIRQLAGLHDKAEDWAIFLRIICDWGRRLVHDWRAQRVTIEALTAERDAWKRQARGWELGRDAEKAEAEAETLRNTLAKADTVIADHEWWLEAKSGEFRRANPDVPIWREEALSRHRSRLTGAPETD